METQACPPLTPELIAKRDRLLKVLMELHHVCIAFSGGVDSAVVAHAAFIALGENAIAITADSPSVARADLADARRVAKQIGIVHRVIATAEFANVDYVRNDGTRCYYCKSELYARIEAVVAELGRPVICSGANLDDLIDYRPGLKAAAEHCIRHPLQEAGCAKADVRILARNWGLDVWDKPASPCLSSRLAPGVAVTPERTARVEAAEQFLHDAGFRECRVRVHEGELARIEVPVHTLPALADAERRGELVEKLRELGFQFVTLDLEGFRTGSLNSLIDIDTKRLFAHTEL